MLKFHISLKKLQLHEVEYVLVEAMLLFSPGVHRGGRSGGVPLATLTVTPPLSPDHAGITQRDIVDQFQEKMALTLKSYMDQQHPMPEGRYVPGGGGVTQPRSPRRGDGHQTPPRPQPGRRFVYAKLLLLLTELQTLKVDSLRQMLHIGDLSSMTPLLSEIIS